MMWLVVRVLDPNIEAGSVASVRRLGAGWIGDLKQ
jgi:hypothetical protein